MSTTTENPGLARWKAALEEGLSTGSMDAVFACLHPDVTFNSPVVHTPYEGAAVTAGILHAVSEVLEDFAYTDILDCGDRAGLVFSARCGDRDVQGWDHLVFDEEGLITDFTVMVRPMSAMHALAEAMLAKLTELGYV